MFLFAKNLFNFFDKNFTARVIDVDNEVSLSLVTDNQTSKKIRFHA